VKAKALALSLILILVPLAGCSGTDTEVTVDMDSEDLQAIIDDNRDDFLNNTTVVVFQEYHNNTTVVNQYSNNSTSNVDQSGASSSTTTYNYNGSSEESEIFVFRAEWDWSDIVALMIDKRTNNFSMNFSYFDYNTNDDRSDTFTLPCSVFYDIPLGYLPSDWTDEGTFNRSIWGNSQYSYGSMMNFYWDYWDDQHNNTIRDLLDEARSRSDVQNICKQGSEDEMLVDSAYYSLGDGIYDYSSAFVFHEMTIPNGSALKMIQLSTMHSYTSTGVWGAQHYENSIAWTVNGIQPNGCRDLSMIVNFELRWESTTSSDCGGYYGGWEDIHLIFQLRNSVYQDSNFVFTMYYELVPVTSL